MLRLDDCYNRPKIVLDVTSIWDRVERLDLWEDDYYDNSSVYFYPRTFGIGKLLVPTQ